MKTERAPFMPVTDDIDDEKLERLAAEKGVAALMRPVSDGAGKPTRAPAPETGTPDAGEAALATEMVSLNMSLPSYVWTAMKIRAAERRTTLKHVIMKALVKDGITIHEADMIEDGRRIR